MFNFNLNVWQQSQTYRIQHWIALNSEAFQEFRNIKNSIEQIDFLEEKLVGNLLSFAKGVGWDVENQIKVRFLGQPKQQWISHKGVKVLAFTTDFYCNVSIPQYLGLGKGAGRGFGMVRRISPEIVKE